MRALVIPVLAIAATACATPRPVDPGHDRPLSVNEHMREARRHEGEAHARQAAATEPEGRYSVPIECYDQPYTEELYSGTERIRVMRPCFTAHRNEQSAYVDVHRQAAEQHRSQAAGLIEGERAACAGLGRDEISHTPFYHREDLARVEPLLEDGVVRGAVITFKPVRGLTADWLRMDIRCHLARAAVMGFSTTYMSYCPLMLPGVTAEVAEGPVGLVVTVRARRDDMAAAVLGRAEDLVAVRP